jgi:hypothetical protein
MTGRHVKILLCEIRGSHGGVHFIVGVVGCNAVWNAGRYQRFGGTYCLHHQSSETLVYTYKSTRVTTRRTNSDIPILDKQLST